MRQLKNLDIFPTGTCFDDGMDYINHIAKKMTFAEIRKMNKEIKIVHSICLLESGEPYAHAWLEKGDKVLFGAIVENEKVQIIVPRVDYYKRFKPQKILKYTIKECCDNEKRIYGYPGPWDREIRNLCKDIKKENLLAEAIRKVAGKK